MYFQQKPIPGYWYSNLAGQLIQVRALVYSAGMQSRVVLEDINGKREYVNVERWRGMDLVLHSPVVEKRNNIARDF